jgi:hypothetical protein
VPILQLNTVKKQIFLEAAHLRSHEGHDASEQVDHQLQESETDLSVKLQALVHTVHPLLADVVVEWPTRQKQNTF